MQADDELHFDLIVSPVDQSFLIQPRIKIGEGLIPKLVRRSYIFYVIELRSGVTQDMIKVILNQVLQSCEEAILHGLDGLSFVINGQHHPVKNLNIASIKELLSKVMVVCENDDYLQTLIKTRHAVQTVAQRLNETKVTLIFFFSYVAIDHTLGKKKISYIDLLNEHSEECLDEVIHLSKSIRRYTEECKCYIISLDKYGVEEEDYSLADTDLMNQINLYVGNYGSTLYRNYSASQLADSFKSVTALLLNQLYSLSILLPTIPDKEFKDHIQYYLSSDNLKEFKPYEDLFLSKFTFDMARAMAGEAKIIQAKKLEEKLGKLDVRGKIVYRELQLADMIMARTKVYNEELNKISWKLSQEIVKYKRKYQLGKSFLVMTINQPLLLNLRDRIYQIYDISKQLYQQIFASPLHNKHTIYEHYSQLKSKIDTIQQVLLGVFKKRIGGSEIGKLSQLISLGPVKQALKNKLVRMVNSNPYLLDQVYRKIESIVDEGTVDYDKLQMDHSNMRAELGNCILSDYNFVKAMKDYDAMGVAFELQRPQAAIADPGRIRIRQVSPSLMRTSQFFEKFIYKINYTPEVVELSLGRCVVCRKANCYLIKHNIPTPRFIEDTKVIKYDKEVVKVQAVEWNKDISSNSLEDKLEGNERIVADVTFQMREVDYLRDKGELYKSNYTERCDYTDRAGRTPTVLGFMPLFLTKQHWRIAKELMKPSLAWTATGEPLGYMFSQFVTIPFIVLSNLIRTNKEKQYQLQAELKKVDSCKDQKELNELQGQVNLMKEKLQRMKRITLAVEETCKTIIIIQLSTEKYQNKLLDTILKQYVDYKYPINRTVDVIPNNSAFISQLYCAFTYELIPKPNEADFHEFFIRLVEEQLRRETDGWNEEQTQDLFVDRLLNMDSMQIKTWEYMIVGGEQYLNMFQDALRGEYVQKNYVKLQKNELEMMLKKEGKFNETQKMLLIQYKRLYENRVLWLWYVRFLLYGQRQRPTIHKWKCVNLGNSYMLFTLIIQNKKQRKNHKRREAITSNQYADPFDIQQARDYLENLFISLKAKREGEAVKKYETQVCVRAAEVFAYSSSLQEAAGTLIGVRDNTVATYYYQLRRGKAVRLAEKLKMLLFGTYRGVYLFRGWKMSKHRFWILNSRYPVEFQRQKYMF